MKAWDPDKVKYEDFLESLDDHQREALAEGDAHIASPKEGFSILKRYCDTLDSGEDGDEDTWKAYLQEFTQENDAKQALADIAMFFIVYAECGNDIMQRMMDLHMETCEKCRNRWKEGTKKRKRHDKAMDAAKAAFEEALAEQDEEWRGEDDDDDDE